MEPYLPEGDHDTSRRCRPSVPRLSHVGPPDVPSPVWGSIPACPPPLPCFGLFIISPACWSGSSNWRGPLRASILVCRAPRERVARHQPLTLIFPIILCSTVGAGKTASLWFVCLWVYVIFKRVSVSFVWVLWLMGAEVQSDHVENRTSLHPSTSGHSCETNLSYFFFCSTGCFSRELCFALPVMWTTTLMQH